MPRLQTYSKADKSIHVSGSERPPQRKDLTHSLLGEYHPSIIKSASQVSQLILERKNGKLVKLGEGDGGRSYLGRVRWDDETVNKVSIKVFKPDGWLAILRGTSGKRIPGPMTGDEAVRYQRAINKMRAEGVRIIKMGVYQISSQDAKQSRLLRKDEFVLVSELFGAHGKTRFYSGFIKVSPFLSQEVLKDAMEQLTRIANAGLWPSYDCIAFFKSLDHNKIDAKKKGVVMDVDFEGLYQNRDIKETTQRNAEFIIDVAETLSSADLPERDLLRVALNHAKGELKEILQKYVKSHYKDS